jgi:hypothetical protein
MAMLHTMKFVGDCCFTKMEFETDSLELIRVIIANNNNCNSYLGIIVQEIKDSNR